MEEVIIPVLICTILFIGLPWIIFHYITKWKTAATLTKEDENLLDELHDVARRLDERMCTIERILQAENPNWRQIACDPSELSLEDRSARSAGLGRETSFGRDSGLGRERSNLPERRV